MNYFEDENDYHYSDEELITLSLTYLVDIEDLTVNTAEHNY